MRKDFDEFRQNKMIISSLAAFPIILAVLVPLATLLPLSSLLQQEQDKIISQADVVVPQTTVELSGDQTGVIANATILSGNVRDAVLTNCIVENSAKVDRAVLNNCLVNGSIENSTVINSTLNTKYVANITVVNSKFVGTSPGLESLKFALDISISMMMAFFVLIPTIIPTLVASYSIVGEKNSRSLEPLLATPITGRELLLGKIFAIFVPAILVTYGAFAIFIAIARAIFPAILARIATPTWALALAVIAPLAALMSIEINVFVSTKYSDVRVAQQIGGLGTLPVFILFIQLLVGISQFTVLLIGFAVGVAVVDAAIFMITDKLFDRESILIRWK